MSKRDGELGRQGDIPEAALPYVTYLNHAEGKGGTDKVLAWARVNGGVTPDVISKYPGPMHNRMSGIMSAMSRVPLWEQVERAMRTAGTLPA